MSSDYTIATDYEWYLNERQKKLDLSDRRPVPPRASDLVGPGIAPTAVRITNFSDLLATFNGFFAYKFVSSSASTAAGAPNTSHSFVGLVVSDAELGGLQQFSSLGNSARYQRTFLRNPSDASVIYWGSWTPI